MVVMGLALAGWVAHNFLVQRQPEAQGHSPLPAIVFALALLGVGANWLFASRQYPG
jgi:hypothetical protein